LVVEVADSSVWADSGAVLETYAAQGIQVYWIVNLPKRRVEVYREPTGPADAPSYRACRQFGPGERVPVVLDGREVGEVAVDDFLP
jgi:Uma2 family endonuclease